MPQRPLPLPLMRAVSGTVFTYVPGWLSLAQPSRQPLSLCLHVLIYRAVCLLAVQGYVYDLDIPAAGVLSVFPAAL